MINIMPELTPVFTAYEALVAEADAVFARVGEMHPDCVTCKPGCSDCCHAMFDLSLVEAMYLNARFIEKYDFGPERSRILENAGSVDRKLTRMKRDYFRELRDAKGSEDAMEHIMEEAAKARIRCPLLDSNDQCVLYDYRPITCPPLRHPYGDRRQGARVRPVEFRCRSQLSDRPSGQDSGTAGPPQRGNPGSRAVPVQGAA